MRSICLWAFLAITLFVPVAQDQFEPPTLDPQQVAGPWESSSASGIDGIYFEISTLSKGPATNQKITSQVIYVRVYHRQGGRETGGSFSTDNKATPDSYRVQEDDSFTLFDGGHLRIQFADASVGDLKPFALDVTFSPEEHSWTGTWTHSGQAIHVVLKRPDPNPGVTPSVFAGDWESEPDPHSTIEAEPGSLHIDESSDGILSAWLDRRLSGIDSRTQSGIIDQRNGEPLRVVSATATGLTLETNFDLGPAYQFRGSLSEDRQILAGAWEIVDGGSLNAPARFRRAP